jgi:hypothetical protein
MVDIPFNGAEVGQRSSEPSLVHIKHSRPGSLLLDGVLSLLLRPDEEDRPPLAAGIDHELVGFLEEPDGLLKIDDVNPVSGAENVLLHLGIPPLGLVAKMNSSFQQLLHGDGGHKIFLLGFSSTSLFPAFDPKKLDTRDRSGSVCFLNLNYTNPINDRNQKKYFSFAEIQLGVKPPPNSIPPNCFNSGTKR